jgi:WD40 repeat protein/tRNA A-37 threonylcarbamoyl transferase component Bud32
MTPLPGDDSGQTLDDELLSGPNPGAGATRETIAPTQESTLLHASALPPQSHLMTVARSSYEFGPEVARGGLGRIVKARDLRLDRVVAIKELIRPTPGSEARFMREIEATVKLQHPNIVAVHEAGRWPDGQLFYAMNFVAGKTLLDVMSEATTLTYRLQLLPTILDIAEAVAFAHSEGVVHRDLKPANVLVGRFGETVVIDWGLAKLLGRTPLVDPALEPPSHQIGVTRAGLVVGTPPYMPPEQAAGKDVDATCDVYALGAILYHVLSGRPPYASTRSGQLLETIRTEPPIPLGDLEADLPPDLLAIVAKAMARRPGDRYPSGAEMAQELQRFTRGRLVNAYTYRARDLLKRFLRRNVGAVATAAAASAVMLVAGAFGIVEIRSERDVAQQNERLATHRLDLAAKRARATIVSRALALTESDPTLAVASLKQLSEPTHGAPSVAARAEEAGVARWILRGHDDSVTCVDVSPDGEQIVSGSQDHTLVVWTLGSTKGRSLVHHSDRVTDCEFSPDGRWIVSGSYDGHVTLWPTDTFTPVALPGAGAAVKAVAFSGDGQYVAAASANHQIGLWHLSDRTFLSYPATNVRRPFIDFRGKHQLVTGPHDGRARLWTVDGTFVESPEQAGIVRVAQMWDSANSIVLGSSLGHVLVWTTHPKAVTAIADLGSEITALSTSGDEPGYAAAATMQGDVVRIDLATQEARRLFRHDERVLALEVSSRQRFIASGGWDRKVHVFDVATDDGRKLLGHTDVISDLAITPNEDLLVTASWDKTVRVWPLRNDLHDRRSVLIGHQVGAHSVRFSPDGRWLASGGHDNTVRMWDLMDKSHRVFRGHTDHVYRVVFSPNGEFIASSSDDRTIRLWSTQDGSTRHVLVGHEADVEEIAYSPDGRLLISASEDHTARLWDTASGTSTVFYHDHAVTQVAFSPDGARVATASRAGRVRLYDTLEKQQIAVYTDHDGEVHAVAFSPDGQWLASAGKTGGLLLRHLETQRTVRWSSLPGAHGLTFSQDGQWLAVSGATPHLWLCEVSSASCSELRAHKSIVRGMRFSPDSKMLVSGGGDGDTFLWDVATKEYRVYQGHRAPIFDLDVSPDGSWIATASGDSTIRLWPRVAVPRAEELPKLLDSLTAETVPDIIADDGIP